jgi:hypothetical protein
MRTHAFARILSFVGGLVATVHSGLAATVPLPTTVRLPSSVLPLAQIPPQVRTGFATVLGLILIISFVRGVILIWEGVERARKSGDISEAKASLFAGALFAGGPVIMGALYLIFGLGDAVLDPVF